MSETAFVIVQDRPYGAGVVAGRPLAEGEVVADLSECVIAEAPSVYTIDVGGDRHIDGPQVRYLNHSCTPNVYVDTERMDVRALRPIAAGEELAFFYPSTEWDMVAPFDCLCGAAECLGTVAGARAAAPEVLRAYRLNRHVAERIAAAEAVRSA
ncbi:SET domain-containing protein [Streptomyces sp. TRM72054]|uniref:SET domain-containing protein-lysine N-methyltransferase n=1 Tax=Streptomyces sp. TRM72054 TaxID=2870562 RepID=UPI001C8CA362|nr:SET domain-containing methyltransferase [Streptomyces sp. TRM72054]MBX9397655.1 SET domain-containing protein [Streptomyces sp. TRM72054]